MKQSLNAFNHLRGIEREALRIDKNGHIAQSFHPRALGAKLTNEAITVDFAESLLELITPPYSSIKQVYDQLTNISAFCAQNMPDNELLLNTSMPLVTKESDVKIADFGTSNSGKMKEIYRRGLAIRYNKIMQSIAGIHYNFSFDQDLIQMLCREKNQTADQLYFSVINHYFDFMWLLPFFFGASPICAKTSVIEKPDYLTEFDDQFYFAEYATSLRMSDLGYQSPAQKSLFISYKDTKSYVYDLVKATNTPYDAFVKLGLYDHNRKRQQLNDSILQIENEYYSSIRPKQIAKRGERPACALLNRGVRYLEIRIMDINPYAFVGIDEQTAHFIEAMLVTCLYLPTKQYSKQSIIRNKANLSKVIQSGRKPGIKLTDHDGTKRTLADTGHTLLNQIEPIAKEMGQAYEDAVLAQRVKLDNLQMTLSAKILQQVTPGNYHKWAIEQSNKAYQLLVNYSIPNEIKHKLHQQARDSINAQKALEQSDCCDIETYIQHYYKSADCAHAK
ncbi:glutamate--cysteine ligase [Facilibium subflavum]|uniref:glutamate--cysteine ligase n=1 Tax=Facilibium subflavum TaxID=2219058 RepID=UPI000E659243|nr:glutamate--cysteine ligase [Facilibium subflavum]